MNKQKKVLDFLKTQKHMSIGTINSNGNPEAAYVGFGEKDDLSLIFGADSTSRKCKNIQKNPTVALVFGDNKAITIQYEGTAAVLKGKELEEYQELYFKKTPSALQYKDAENQVFLKIVPHWIRYTDYNKDPEEIFEITLG